MMEDEISIAEASRHLNQDPLGSDLARPAHTGRSPFRKMKVRRDANVRAGMRRHRLAVLVAAGCGLVAACYPIPRVAPVVPVGEPVSNYAPGETLTATPGTVMIDRTDGSQILPGFILKQPIRVLGTDKQPTEEAGLWAARFEYRGDCPDGHYILTNPFFYEERIGIITTRDGTIVCDPPVIQLVGGNRGRTWRLEDALPIQPFSPVPYIAGFSQDAVRWQLLYGGRTGNTVTLEYREFRNGAFDDNAAPVYQQQLTYDLRSTKTITFRKTQLEVLRATDRDIAFRVLHEDARATRMPPPPPRPIARPEHREDERGGEDQPPPTY